MLCDECQKRDFCMSLCPEAELYVKQDSNAANYHKAGDLHFTPTEKKILSLLAKGKGRPQIRNYLKLSINALEFHISNLRKKAEGIVL